ncbi:hypothetical protein Q5762_14600 [Streptomyces sp. P9(2023)]|uniref:hypothetical protein n=1 Tax=Streptomyces sp. P9(2023) TaxID=3064394 RepID=UPI0028F4268B|nr:hypothetical protein [Streptomyces sp. P9(2023)]MDT9689546.1 hypothetical protein [Streptomyces sp. P9(2023)]
MQIMHTPGGDAVAVMKAKELLLTEVALMAYVAENPDSNLAVRVMRDVVTASEEAERCAEEAAESAGAAASA